MKVILIVISFFFLNYIALSQELTSYVSGGVAYINYIVSKGEGINQVAARFAVTPEELLAINGLQASSIVQESQSLKIPVNKIIAPVCNGDNCTKVYYEVQQSEGLYRIGVNYGNTKVAQLKKLNNLSSESVSLGQRLLVGYLILNKSDIQKLVDNNNVITPVPVAVAATKTETLNGKKQDSILSKAESKPTKDNKVVVTNNNPSNPVQEKKLPADTLFPAVNINSFFESQYAAGNSEIILIASTFKSESGWQDGKFYVLMDNLPVGSIVKIVNPLVNALIFAKVLGALPVVKDNGNIKMRISNAGAAALKTPSEDHFEVQVTY